jgi:hypothetical protein
MDSPMSRLRVMAGLGMACLAFLLSAGSASAATTVYPSGGSGFNTSAEGWSPGASSCAPIALLCTPEAVYDAGIGNPPGSIAAKTKVTLNLLSLFSGTEVWNSPQFKVPVGAVTGASVRLDRAFEAGGLVEVGPKATYTVTLHDLTAGTDATLTSEELTKVNSTFAPHSAPASVVSGHTYQLTISTTTAQSNLSLSLLSGTSAVHFDNVGLVVQTSGDGGGGGGGGGDTLTNSELRTLIQQSLVGPAILTKGKRVMVRAKCPAKVGVPCRVALQGKFSKRKAVTASRAARIAKGKAKRVALRVKPRSRAKVLKSRTLLFKVTVRAGKAHATVYKRLKLIKRNT